MDSRPWTQRRISPIDEVGLRALTNTLNAAERTPAVRAIIVQVVIGEIGYRQAAAAIDELHGSTDIPVC